MTIPLRISSEEDVDTAWAAARANFAWADYSALLTHIPKAILARAFAADLLGACEIGISAGRWSRLFQGSRAIVIPVFGATGELLDLVAFRLETPRSFWCFGATVPALGQDSLARAADLGEPLFVHDCPLSWLRSGREGIVILDWKAWWPGYLEGIPSLRASTVAFGRRLKQALQHPAVIPTVEVAAA